MRIAVDCEFSFDESNEYYLVCAAVTQEDGVTHTWWLDQLDELKAYILEHKDDIWVAHNVETAEGYMFQSLGLSPTRFKWHDTLMMSRIVYNACSERRAKHDLATCLSRERIVKLDKEEKHDNQNICVWYQNCLWSEHLQKLEDNKQKLMEYCLSDTAYLLPLDKILDQKMKRRLVKPLDFATPLEPERRSGYYGFLAAYTSEISWAGIPLDPVRVSQLLDNAPKAMSRSQVEFARKYPGSFRMVGKKLTKNVAVCRDYAEKAYGSSPKKTKKGLISLASEYTKDYKDLDDNFLGDYYNLDKKCRALASFSKRNREKNWLGMYLPRRGIIRPRINLLGTQTGRCGSKPSSGFIYTMGKCFRGLINPPEGYVVVELDFHSEEIGCQAYLTGDKTMAQMYEGPDYYTAIAQRLDPTVKDKHDPKRKKYKVISLMSNYGCGAAHLAEIAGIPETEARAILRDLKRMFRVYWQYVGNRLDYCSEEMHMCFSDGFRITNKGGKSTSLGNWPFQGVGALILRHLLVKLWKAKIRVVAPIHDAIAFMCKEEEWQDVSRTVANLMKEASKECLGTVIDVGDPEVTYHNIPNCHSELSTREQYLTEPPNKYLQEFQTYTGFMDDQIKPDSDNLYVDEEWKKENE